jgi:hypothetical protein
VEEAAIIKRIREFSEALSRLTIPIPGHKVVGEYVPEGELSSDYSSPDESMDYLGLQIKYLIFDLEATRRENRYLLRMLENRPRPDKSEDDQTPGF